MLDGVVIILAFTFGVLYARELSIKSGIGLIIALRFWRITKIINGKFSVQLQNSRSLLKQQYFVSRVLFTIGVLASVRHQSERRLLRERRTREALEQELSKFREYCSAQEFEIRCLQALLRKNGVTYDVLQRPVMGRKIDVVVEVNKTRLSDSDVTHDDDDVSTALMTSEERSESKRSKAAKSVHFEDETVTIEMLAENDVTDADVSNDHDDVTLSRNGSTSSTSQLISDDITQHEEGKKGNDN